MEGLRKIFFAAAENWIDGSRRDGALVKCFGILVRQNWELLKQT